MIQKASELKLLEQNKNKRKSNTVANVSYHPTNQAEDIDDVFQNKVNLSKRHEIIVKNYSFLIALTFLERHI